MTEEDINKVVEIIRQYNFLNDHQIEVLIFKLKEPVSVLQIESE